PGRRGRGGAGLGRLLPAGRHGRAAVRGDRGRLFHHPGPAADGPAGPAALARRAEAMIRTITGATRVAGVVGSPIAHSLSPLIRNAWREGGGSDGVYVPLSVMGDGFAAFLDSLRAASVVGLNVTLPFKAAALAAADNAHPRAVRAHAANVLTFKDGRVWADNTDGLGLLAAFAEQARGFDPAAGPVAIVGAGGGARGAAAAFADAGCPQVRIVNRTRARAETLADELGAQAFALEQAAGAFDGVTAVINA